MDENSDKELIKLIKRGGRKKEEAFSEIVERYSQRLYWHIRKFVINHDDANDVLQNTFIKIFQNIDKFRGDSKLYTWLYRIATNESITFIEKQRKANNLSIDDELSYLGASLQSDEYFSGDEMQLKLQKAILTLPDKQRLVFNMKYFDDMKYQDISEVLGTSVGALKASYHHAVSKIKEYLTE